MVRTLREWYFAIKASIHGATKPNLRREKFTQERPEWLCAAESEIYKSIRNKLGTEFTIYKSSFSARPESVIRLFEDMSSEEQRNSAQEHPLKERAVSAKIEVACASGGAHKNFNFFCRVQSNKPGVWLVRLLEERKDEKKLSRSHIAPEVTDHIVREEAKRDPESSHATSLH